MTEFFLKYKKIILLAGFMLVVVGLGYLLYLLFFRPLPSAPAPAGGQTATTTGGLPTAATGTGQVITETGTGGGQGAGLPAAKASPVALGGLTATAPVNNTPSLGAVLGANGQDIRFYDKTSGQFYYINSAGEKILLSDKIFHQVENITWSPDADKAVLEYPDGSNIMYDFSLQKQTTLPRHFEDFDFSPDGNRFVAKSMGIDPDNRWLVVANPDGSSVTALEGLGENADSVYSSWSPNSQMVAMFTRGAGLDRQEVFFVGLNNENFKSTMVEGRGFRSKWSPDGNRLLYSVYSTDNGMKPQLWIVDAAGDNIGADRKNLNMQTWADKCVFADNARLYCAVPETLAEGAGLFPELAQATKDDLYLVNPETGSKKLTAIPDGDYNMSDLIVSDNGYYLYFTDVQTGLIYKIKLK